VNYLLFFVFWLAIYLFEACVGAQRPDYRWRLGLVRWCPEARHAGGWGFKLEYLGWSHSACVKKYDLFDVLRHSPLNRRISGR